MYALAMVHGTVPELLVVLHLLAQDGGDCPKLAAGAAAL